MKLAPGERRHIERATATATSVPGRSLNAELRPQVASAGLGQRLANSWRHEHYPPRKLEAPSVRQRTSLLGRFGVP